MSVRKRPGRKSFGNGWMQTLRTSWAAISSSCALSRATSSLAFHIQKYPGENMLSGSAKLLRSNPSADATQHTAPATDNNRNFFIAHIPPLYHQQPVRTEIGASLFLFAVAIGFFLE